MKTISHLVAVSNNLVIGVDNDLPWNLRADLAHFKKYTFNKIIIMGRKTFESIGKPLPNRINFVVSKTLNEIPGAYVFNNLDEAILIICGVISFLIFKLSSFFLLAIKKLLRLELSTKSIKGVFTKSNPLDLKNLIILFLYSCSTYASKLT